ncbi:cytochrome c oxidase assembly protein COX20, mitochondrial [Suricata suricatta]|uniref:Cytochrome c oxidase assembly protein COX20, mitochondrial n=1 Tax=Suricata suricatta TaxID=37032 RepID=A0A673TC93_SURSU|nr:cytochrome c oxidase assembly protein COX20, mitochondrial [Suricata suricatta]
MAAAPQPGEPAKGKTFKLLGILDVENIPCARDSVLYGSLGSVVVGLGHFLFTSRIRRSCDVGVGGFILVTLGCWFHCRYNYAKLRIQERMAREGIKNKILYESTHLDPQRKPANGSGSSGVTSGTENPATSPWGPR